MTQHTTGPWEIDDRPESDWVFIEPLVCQIARGSEHNAALIAAAPAMLEALQVVSTWLIAPDTSAETLQDIRDIAASAIAIATGNAPWDRQGEAER